MKPHGNKNYVNQWKTTDRVFEIKTIVTPNIENISKLFIMISITYKDEVFYY